MPAKEVADGALVVLGGALLLTPGFVTDVLGVLCLLPPTRAVLRRLLTGTVASRLLPGVSVGRRGTTGARHRASSRPGGVVDGEVIDGEAAEEGRAVPGSGQADSRRSDGRVRLDKPKNGS